MEKDKIALYKNFMDDLDTFANMKNNENYKNALLRYIGILLDSQIITYEDFMKSSIDFGEFSYHKLTYFKRVKDEQYLELLSEAYAAVALSLSQKKNKYFGDSNSDVMIPKR